MVRERNSGFGRLEMKNLYKSEQSGRSMVEMLGVLAIIGVLSVGGIAGYSKAMAKYKTTQTLDQLSMLVANIRTAFSSATSYEDLTTEKARNWGLASSDMNDTTDEKKLVNPFLGQVEIGPATGNGVTNLGFVIQYANLPREACVSIATAGWGEGFSGLSAGKSEGGVPSDIEKAATNGNVAFGDAADLCTSDTNSIALFFY